MKRFKEVLAKTSGVVRRYPMVLSVALVAATAAVTGISLDNEPNQFLVTKLAFSGCLGISLMFGIKMLTQRFGRQMLWECLGLMFLVCFFLYLPDNQKDFTDQYAYIIFPTFILSHLFVSFSAFVNNRSELSFWQFNKNLFLNFFLTAIFTFVLVGGVGLAILATDKLFDLNLDYRIYPKTIFFFAILGSTLIFLIFCGDGLYKLENDRRYPEILKFFTQCVLIPLLSIYAIILYFYCSKILITWQLPKGWVSYLILAYAIVGVLASLLVHPLKENSAKSWVRSFSKAFFYTLLPLLGLLFIAIFTRVLQYGFTEPRYFVLLLAVWLTVVALYFTIIKNSDIRFIPFSLFVFGIFAMIFPYLNAFSVSRQSQKKELVKILNENHLLKNGKIDFNKKVRSTVVEEIGGKISFLENHREQKFMAQFLDEETLKSIKTTHSQYAIQNIISIRFKNIESNSVQPDAHYRLHLIAIQKFKNVSGYEYAAKIQDFSEASIPLDGNEIVIEKNLIRNLFIISENGKDKKDLFPALENLLPHNRTGDINVPEIALETDLKDYHVKIFIDEIWQEEYQNKKPYLYMSDALVLVKRK